MCLISVKNGFEQSEIDLGHNGGKRPPAMSSHNAMLRMFERLRTLNALQLVFNVNKATAFANGQDF